MQENLTDALPPWGSEPYAHERVRIAYFCSEFRQHAITFLMAGVFEQLDRSRFEVIGVSLGAPAADDMRQRLERAFDRFIDANAMSDRQVAALAREMAVDIAIDLSGYSGEYRPGIFALRTAPVQVQVQVQVNYLGYPGTMGADFIDYMIADKTVVPPAQQESYTEKMAYPYAEPLPIQIGSGPHPGSGILVAEYDAQNLRAAATPAAAGGYQNEPCRQPQLSAAVRHRPIPQTSEGGVRQYGRTQSTR